MDFDEFDEIEDFDDQEEQEISRLLAIFDRHFEEGSYAFLDVEEFETIINRYILLMEMQKLDFALKNAEKVYPDNPYITLKKAYAEIFEKNYDAALDWVMKASRFAETSGTDMSDFLPKRADVYLDLEYFYLALLDLQQAKKLPGADLPYIEELLKELYFMAFQFQTKSDEAVLGFEYTTELFEQIKLSFPTSHHAAESAKIFEYYIHENPFNVSLWKYLGIALMESEQYQEAIDAFDYCLALEPDSITAQFYKAICLKLTGLYEQAIEILLNIQYPPEDAGHIFFELGENLLQLKFYDEAAKYYRMTIEKELRIGDAYFGLSKISLYKDEDYSLGLQYIDRAINYRKEASYLAWKGTLLSYAGDMEKAGSYLKESLEMDPENVQIRIQYAEMFARQNQYDQAVDILDMELDNNFFNIPLLIRRISFLFKSGRKEEAFSTLNLMMNFNAKADKELFSYAPELGDNNEFLLILDNIKTNNKI